MGTDMAGLGGSDTDMVRLSMPLLGLQTQEFCFDKDPTNTDHGYLQTYIQFWRIFHLKCFQVLFCGPCVWTSFFSL